VCRSVGVAFGGCWRSLVVVLFFVGLLVACIRSSMLGFGFLVCCFGALLFSKEDWVSDIFFQEFVFGPVDYFCVNVVAFFVP